MVAYLSDGSHIPEIGIGGGGDDLHKQAELELAADVDVDALVRDM